MLPTHITLSYTTISYCSYASKNDLINDSLSLWIINSSIIIKTFSINNFYTYACPKNEYIQRKVSNVS